VNDLHIDRNYYFCALSCKNQIERSPEEYLEDSAEPEKNQNSHTLLLNITESYPANLDKLELIVNGMSHASCVARIEKGLSIIQGVSYAKVDFAAEKATIVYDPLKLNSSDLVRAISELGYKAKIQKVIFPVQGLSCASRADRIRDKLRQIHGVIAVNINFTTEKATVEYILGQVETIDLVKAIEAVVDKFFEIGEDQFVDK
jgi:Cu+-exporting ATPase